MNIFGIGSFSSYFFWLFVTALNVIALANLSIVILIPLWLLEAVALFLIVRWANAPEDTTKEDAEYKRWRQFQWGNFDKTIADIEAREKLAKERAERYERENND